MEKNLRNIFAWLIPELSDTSKIVDESLNQ